MRDKRQETRKTILKIDTSLVACCLPLVACCLLLVALPSLAAVLYLEPAAGNYHQGDTFLVNLRIDTEAECVNTVEGNLSFSQEYLELLDFSQGGSILGLWLKNPDISQGAGLVSFIGGIPGGNCGLVSGDPGQSNLLGKIIFKVKDQKLGEAKVEFQASSKVLLNDGLGTPSKVTLKPATFEIISGVPSVPKNEWQTELSQDSVPPEPFVIEIHQDSSVFDGQYFIVFQTQDKQTGIDHYEVQEIPPSWTFKNIKSETQAQSPYLLKDQSLSGIIIVRAVDKAGNEMISELPPTHQPFSWLIIAVILIGAGIILMIIRYFKERRHGKSTIN